MIKRSAPRSTANRLARLLALATFGSLALPALAQSAAGTEAPAPPAAAAGKDAAARPAARKVSPYQQQKVTHNAQARTVAQWGVDRLKVTYTASGNLIRFSYRVVEPERAKTLADKGASPYLVGKKNNVALQVPVMEKVGPLRQSTAPLPGKEYWMVFSNKGNLIRRGDRVNVIIGSFRADGLMVE